MSLDIKQQELIEISKEHRVSSRSIFGSALTDSFDKENRTSLDFLVEFQPEYFDGYTENYEDLKGKLEILYKRKVDILSYKSIQNPFLLIEVDSTKELIYA
jgi:predicted nucleotidyltransferase